MGVITTDIEIKLKSKTNDKLNRRNAIAMRLAAA